MEISGALPNAPNARSNSWPYFRGFLTTFNHRLIPSSSFKALYICWGRRGIRVPLDSPLEDLVVPLTRATSDTVVAEPTLTTPEMASGARSGT